MAHLDIGVRVDVQAQIEIGLRPRMPACVRDLDPSVPRDLAVGAGMRVGVCVDVGVRIPELPEPALFTSGRG
jgi:hypothetical protein